LIEELFDITFKENMAVAEPAAGYVSLAYIAVQGGRAKAKLLGKLFNEDHVVQNGDGSGVLRLELFDGFNDLLVALKYQVKGFY